MPETVTLLSRTPSPDGTFAIFRDGYTEWWTIEQIRDAWRRNIDVVERDAA